MKKILILLLALFLSACGAKTPAWEEVKDSFLVLESQAAETAATNEDFLTADYRSLLKTISEGTENLRSGVKEEDGENAKTLYLNASLLEELVSSCEGPQAETLAQLGKDLKQLIIAAYDKSSDFDQLKASLSSSLKEIGEQDDTSFSSVEKKKKILWAQVKEEYEDLAARTIEELPWPSEVTEMQLEGYKNTILNNCELIRRGVHEDNRINADVIYEAATALHEYTYRMNSVEADKVNRFAIQACQYVEECYGEKIDDPDYDFDSAAGQAAKWTLSLWNELVKLLNM
jgi:hypothetical protein